MSNPIISKEKYRPEIDGLRAFAVAVVIINHFNKDLLPSGYLGVDIFFVISGYVITSSLYGRHSKNFRDFMSGFYERRIKRLIPTLIIVVVTTSFLVSSFIYIPGKFHFTGFLSLFGISNFYLTGLDGGYWGEEVAINPFMHTWSLGVEEQFYLLFPLLIWFTGFGKQTKNSSRNFFLLICFLSIISLICFIYYYLAEYSGAYFLMPFRFWEISAGVLVFIALIKKVSIYRYFKQFSPGIVIALIFAVMFLPLSYAVLATCLTVILSSILILMLRPETTTFNILSNSKIMYIGRISYPLYLWHWPILALARWTIGITKITFIPLLLGMILISIISYELIEKKLRISNWPYRRIFTFFIGLSLVLGAAFFNMLLSTKLKGKLFLGERSLNQPKNILPKSTFYLIGDSHAHDIGFLLRANGSYKVKPYSIAGCNFFSNESKNCSKHSKNIDRVISSVKEGDVVLFASNYLNDFIEDPNNDEKLIKYFKEILPILLSKGINIVLKLPHPQVNNPKDFNLLFCKKEFFRPYLDKKCSVEGVPKNEFFKKRKSIDPVIKILKKDYPELLYWDISNITCPEEYCFPVKDGEQYLRDGHHLFLGSHRLSDALITDLNKLLIKD